MKLFKYKTGSVIDLASIVISCSKHDKSESAILFPLVEGSQITAKVSSSVPISLPNITYTSISFDTKCYDTGGFFNISSPDRLVIPSSGKYYILGQLEYTHNTTGIRKANILVNEDTFPYLTAANLMPASRSASYDAEIQVEAFGSFHKGDTIHLQAFQDSGEALSLKTSTYSPVLVILKLSE